MLRILWAAATALAIAAGAAWAADERLDTELKFAKGLTELGYYDLADFHLDRVGWRDREDDEQRTRVVMAKADNFQEAAAKAPDAVRAVRRMRQAVAVLDAYLELDLPQATRDRVLERRGHASLELGTRANDVVQRQPPDVDLEAAAAEAARAFESAEESFSKAIAEYRKTVEEIEAKRAITDEDRETRAELLPRIVLVETQMGWARYRRAQLFKDAGDDKAYREGLKAAAELFKAQSEARDTILAGYSAALGYGLCKQELGEHKEAIGAFDRAILVRPEPHTNMIRFQGMYQKAVSQAALKEYDEAISTLENMRREFRSLPSFLQDAWQMSYGRFHAAKAAELLAEREKVLARREEVREERPDNWARIVERLGSRADAMRLEARRLYEEAMSAVRGLAGGDGEYAHEASLLLGQWADAAGIERRRSAQDWFSEGERLLEAGELEQAVRAYQSAITAAGAGRAERRAAHDSWIQMGKALAQMRRYYEAGLVFGRAARLYPDSNYAESLAIYSSMLLGHAYERGQSDLESRAYFDAQMLLVDRFPRTEQAGRAAFRLGDVERAQERFVAAAEYYARVSRASEFYERAQYLAGWCLWQEAVRRGGEAGFDPGLALDAESRLQAFLSWAEEQRVVGEEATLIRAEWVGQARLLMADIYQDQGRYDDVVAVALAEDALEALAPRPDLVGRARVQRVRALCAEEDAGAARLAGAEIAALRGNDAVEPDVKSAAAQLVATTFLKLAEQESGPALAPLFRDARRFLVEAIDLKADPQIADYEEAASSLFQAQAYGEAVELFRLLVKRYQGSPDYADAVRDARQWIGRAYREAGDWDKAAEQFAELVAEFPEWVEVRRELALALESEALAHYADAERHWRVLENALDMGSDPWFEARYHRVLNLARSDRTPLALQLLATTSVPYPALGGAERREQFEEIVEEYFTEEQKRSYRDLAQAD